MVPCRSDIVNNWPFQNKNKQKTCWDFDCNECIDQNLENGHLNNIELLIP